MAEEIVEVEVAEEGEKMTDRNWNIYEGAPNAAGRKKLRVTLGVKKALLMNRHAYAAFGSPSAIQLMYDGDRGLIGMKPCDPQKKNAFPVKTALQGRHHIVYAAAFFSHINLKPQRTILFDQIDIDPDGTIVLDLAKTIYVTRGSRN